MIVDNKILIGKSEDKEVFLLPQTLNRHGLIAGATGTGKTITMKVIAEGLSDLAIPCFIADIKGDVSGMAKKGDDRIQQRITDMNLENFTLKGYPSCFYDVYGENGHPVRATIEDMGSILLANVLELTPAQEGVLAIAFKVASDLKMPLVDLNDLKACLQYISDNNQKLLLEYGNITKQSIGSILRNILMLEQEGGNLFFGEPSLDIYDLLKAENGGVINILDCQKLFQKPKLYTTFLIWILNKLYNELPEVGDLDKPKIVFFFDEAHLIFNNPSKVLLEKVQQVIKLIRSKGVGIFFCTQNPRDIDDSVLAQLSNRFQHALRAYTPNEIKAVKLAADSFRQNPNFDTSQEITALKKGEALVSVLDEHGAPTIVERTKICPPSSSMDALTSFERIEKINLSSLYHKYTNRIERETAYEGLQKLKQQELAQAELQKQKEELEKEKLKLEKEKTKMLEKEYAKQARQQEKYQERQAKRREKYIDRTITTATGSITREITKSIFKGIKNLFK